MRFEIEGLNTISSSTRGITLRWLLTWPGNYLGLAHTLRRPLRLKARNVAWRDQACTEENRGRQGIGQWYLRQNGPEVKRRLVNSPGRRSVLSTMRSESIRCF